MKKIISLIGISYFVLLILSSCNYLDIDKYSNETLDYDSVFFNKRNIEKYLWGTAAFFPAEDRIFGNSYTPGPMATDEAFTIYYPDYYRGMAYVLGRVTPYNTYGMTIWDDLYKIIRKSNTILKRMDEAEDLSNIGKQNLLGYTHFMRGYAYYQLLMQYGPVVLVGDNIYETNKDPEYYDLPRSTYDECVDYICKELEKGAALLPEFVPVNNFGRPSKGAAYALIARLRLQHASPLFNGKEVAKKYYGSWTRTVDGAHYISQEYDEKRWAIAAYSAKRVIDMGLYKIHTVTKVGATPSLPSNVSNEHFPYGAGDIDPFMSYADMFTGETVPSRNPEIIWGKWSGEVESHTRHSFPKAVMEGGNCICITQNVVDQFYMRDGRTIKNSSSEYSYSEEGMIGGSGEVFSGYTLLGTANKMYANREMRFYANIGFSGRLWPANSTTQTEYKNKVVNYYFDGLGGKANAGDAKEEYAITGYVLSKYVHPDDAWRGDNAQRVPKSFPIIRYAEILLSYVEALNNLTTSYDIVDELEERHSFSRNTEEIKFYFNQIRFRAGLPGLTDEEVNSRETVQKLIERERLIEFLFENRRYYDVRRWGIYEETEEALMIGLNTDATQENYFERVPINHWIARNRVVDKKMILFPLYIDEIRKSKIMDQNPGWDD